MEKKNKCFTIPELFAVIVINGILVTIASASYKGISKTLKEKTYKNKIRNNLILKLYRKKLLISYVSRGT